MQKDITQDLVQSLFTYEPETGLFRWRVNRPPRGQVGAVAGNDNGSGYIKLSIRGKRYYAHHIVFLWMEGYIPKEVDHINQCRSDNRWSNLRATTRSENCSNVSGRKGVRKKNGKWYARFSNTHLGVFDSLEEAIEARRKAEITAAGFDPNSEREVVPYLTKKWPRYLFGGRSISDWSKLTGIPYQTLYWRFKQGWSVEEATTISTTR